MSKLSIDQKTIEALFSDKKTDFLIPDYQRPYAWEFKECQQLWEDIFSFAFSDDDYEKFNNDPLRTDYTEQDMLTRTDSILNSFLTTSKMRICMHR